MLLLAQSLWSPAKGQNGLVRRNSKPLPVAFHLQPVCSCHRCHSCVRAPTAPTASTSLEPWHCSNSCFSTCYSTAAKDSAASGSVYGQEATGTAPAWEGPEAQGPPAMPYPGITEEVGVVGVSLGLPHGWDKEHSRVMHGFTFAACT